MSTRYPHSCTVTRPNPVDNREIDAESGQPIGNPPAPVTVYNGRCRYTSDGSAVRRAKGGRVDIAGEGVVELPAAAAVFNTETDRVSVQANGVSLTARIVLTDYRRFEVHLLVTPESVPS